MKSVSLIIASVLATSIVYARDPSSPDATSARLMPPYPGYYPGNNYADTSYYDNSYNYPSYDPNYGGYSITPYPNYPNYPYYPYYGGGIDHADPPAPPRPPIISTPPKPPIYDPNCDDNKKILPAVVSTPNKNNRDTTFQTYNNGQYTVVHSENPGASFTAIQPNAPGIAPANAATVATSGPSGSRVFVAQSVNDTASTSTLGLNSSNSATSNYLNTISSLLFVSLIPLLI